MNLKKIIYGVAIASLVIACTTDEIEYENENTLQESEISNQSLEQTSSKAFDTSRNLRKPPLPLFEKKPRCEENSGAGYREMKVIYSNFSRPQDAARRMTISTIRRRYDLHYNVRNSCQGIIFPPDFTAVCKDQICYEYWRIHTSTGIVDKDRPEVRTVPIDTEAPGP